MFLDTLLNLQHARGTHLHMLRTRKNRFLKNKHKMPLAPTLCENVCFVQQLLCSTNGGAAWCEMCILIPCPNVWWVPKKLQESKKGSEEEVQNLILWFMLSKCIVGQHHYDRHHHQLHHYSHCPTLAALNTHPVNIPA